LLKKANTNENGSTKGYPSTAMEKEKLFEERQHLKSTINILRKEMAVLKSDNLKKDNEISKKEKVIEDIVVDSQNNVFGLNSSDFLSKAKEANLLFKIKRQFKELKKEYNIKCEELENLKKTMKVTKFNELSIEISALTQEIEKLKKLYLHSLQQNELFENSLKDYQILQDNFQKQHYLIINLQEGLTKSSEEIKEKDEESKKLKFIIEERNTFLKKLKKELQSSQSALEKMKQDKKENNELVILRNKYESQIADLTREMNRFRDLADRKDRQVRELESNARKMIPGETQEKTRFFNYNDIKYIQENPESKLDNLTLLLKSKLQEKIKENEKLKNKNKLLEEKLEMIEQQTGIKIKNEESQEEEEEEDQNFDNKNEDSQRLRISQQDYNEENDPYKTKQFDDDQFTEFTYIIIKNFEAKKLSRSAAEKMLREDTIGTFSDTNSMSNNFIKNISVKLIKFLKIKNEEEKSKVNIFMNTLWNLTGKNLELFEEKFFALFDNIKTYSDEEFLTLSKKLKKNILQYSSFLLNSLKLVDINNSGYVTFLTFRKILESVNLKLKDRYIEFLIYIMKSNDEKEESIYSLNYEAMFRLINKAPDDSKMESSEIDYENEEESEIVITQEEFNEKINRFYSKLSVYLQSKNITIRDLFRGKIYKVDEFEKSEVFKNIKDEAVELQTFLYELKNIGLDLSNLDVYCIFTKLKIIDDYEAISIQTLESELSKYYKDVAFGKGVQGVEGIDFG
jgi:hypothetical protein